VTHFPVILSSPSGGGKTTITRLLLVRRSDVGYSISCTTRPPRSGERDGTDYFFLTREVFEARRRRGEFVESAEVHGNLYGTLRSEIERVLASGKHVVMDIDVQGARQISSAYGDALRIFLLPPSAETLVQRLSGRGTEDASVLARRFRNAREELRAASSYDYVVVNEQLESTYDRVSAIIDAESVRRVRQPELERRLATLVAGLEQHLTELTSTS
jgi:guanylate kinase